MIFHTDPKHLPRAFSPAHMDTYLSLEYGHHDELPPGYADEVRTPDVLVERFLEEYTDPGDRVFDPFAGFGTTLFAAERLDRVPYGIEYEPDRVEHVRDRLDTPENVRHGDVLGFDPDAFPDCDLLFTSPPFMIEGMERNPFENYAGESTYEGYLGDVERAFERLRGVLAPGATAVVDIVNMRHEDRVTTLAWDVADRVAESLRFDGEVVVAWEGDGYPDREGNYGYGFDHSYCLVFENDD